MFTLIKIGLSAVIVGVVAEIAKRSTVFGALVASLPLTSLLAIVWLYHDTHDTARVAALSGDIFWLVLPSLLLFVLLPLLIKRGVGFYSALGLAIGATVIAYVLVGAVMQRLATKS
jgi:hypothetical protein